MKSEREEAEKKLKLIAELAVLLIVVVVVALLVGAAVLLAEAL